MAGKDDEAHPNIMSRTLPQEFPELFWLGEAKYLADILYGQRLGQLRRDALHQC